MLLQKVLSLIDSVVDLIGHGKRFVGDKLSTLSNLLC